MSTRPTITAGDIPGTIVIVLILPNGDRIVSTMNQQAAYEFANEISEAYIAAFEDCAKAAMYRAQKQDQLAAKGT